jgi:hypothetical protein
VRGWEKLLSCDLVAVVHQLNDKSALLVAPTLIIPVKSQVDFGRLPRHLSSVIEVLLGIRVCV